MGGKAAEGVVAVDGETAGTGTHTGLRRDRLGEIREGVVFRPYDVPRCEGVVSRRCLRWRQHREDRQQRRKKRR